MTAPVGFFHCIGAFVESLLAFALRLVHASEGPRQISQQNVEGPVVSGLPRHHDIVEAVLGFVRGQLCDRRFEAAANTVAGDGAAELLGHREAEAWSRGGGSLGRAGFGFKQANGHGGPEAAAHSEEFTSRFEGREGQSDRPVPEPQRPCEARAEPVEVSAPRVQPLGRQALAAFGAAASQNLLTTGGKHALAEAVAALAHEAAGLISAFHATSPSNQKPPASLRG